jgi:Sec-independent protein translocase protein TatA
MNAVQGEISFPTNRLEVLSISQTNSVISLWVQNPTFSNQDGTIDFGGVSPNPGFQGNGGNIITIRFEAKNSGSAALTFNSGSVLANDGKGTNILTSMGSANFAIAPLASVPVPVSTAPVSGNGNTIAPVIINSTPQIISGEWHNLNQITFDWSVPTDADGVDYTISNNANLQLPDVNQGMISQTSYDLSNFADGVWYFFVSFESGSAWSSPVMEKLMLDRTPPEPFIISRVDTNQADKQPIFAWSANDDMSGIDHYEVKIGNGDWFNASAIQNGSSSYILPPQAPIGVRTLTVRAFDKAGNYTDASLNFSVLPLTALSAPCEKSAFFCGLSGIFSEWGWAIAGILIILLLLAYGFIYHLLRWKKSSSKELKKFEDELRRDLKAVQEEAEKVRDNAVDLRPTHLEQEKRQLEKEIKHISEDVKEEIKELGE